MLLMALSGASAGHLANMANPAYSSIGIGAVWSNGVLWTAHPFAGRSGGGFVLDDPDFTAGLTGIAADPTSAAFDTPPCDVAAATAEWVIQLGDAAV
jgi:hypothetical protein